MDIEQMIRLVNTVSASNLTGFSYEESGMTVRLEKKQGKTVIQQTEQVTENRTFDHTEQNQPVTETKKVITSPLVGVFYAAPAEDAPSFVKVGDKVEAGQVVGIVEAMKLMNEIESECAGTVAEVLVENGEPVEYGQPLFRIV